MTMTVGLSMAEVRARAEMSLPIVQHPCLMANLDVTCGQEQIVSSLPTSGGPYFWYVLLSVLSQSPCTMW